MTKPMAVIKANTVNTKPIALSHFSVYSYELRKRNTASVLFRRSKPTINHHQQQGDDASIASIAATTPYKKPNKSSTELFIREEVRTRPTTRRTERTRGANRRHIFDFVGIPPITIYSGMNRNTHYHPFLFTHYQPTTSDRAP